jgi:hypothetical protein
MWFGCWLRDMTRVAKVFAINLAKAFAESIAIAGPLSETDSQRHVLVISESGRDSATQVRLSEADTLTAASYDVRVSERLGYVKLHEPVPKQFTAECFRGRVGPRRVPTRARLAAARTGFLPGRMPCLPEAVPRYSVGVRSAGRR